MGYVTKHFSGVVWYSWNQGKTSNTVLVTVLLIEIIPRSPSSQRIPIVQNQLHLVGPALEHRLISSSSEDQLEAKHEVIEADHFDQMSQLCS